MEPLKRVRYFTGQLLSVDDLRTEQEYFLRKLRWHNRMLLGSGIASGLGLSVQKNGIQVEPGMAVDKHGNEIVLCNPQTIPFPSTGNVAYLVIRYIEKTTDPVPAPAGGGARNAGTEDSRIEEGFELAYLPSAPDPADQNWVILAKLKRCCNTWRIESGCPVAKGIYKAALIVAGIVLGFGVLRVLEKSD